MLNILVGSKWERGNCVSDVLPWQIYETNTEESPYRIEVNIPSSFIRYRFINIISRKTAVYNDEDDWEHVGEIGE